MSILRKAFKQGTWLAFFKLIAQATSWVFTILIARILSPDDYGLMSIATIFTGYAMLFSELGLGASIIQAQDVKDDELSSIFWFSFGFSILLASSCFLLAYPTAWVFHEKRVIPITQTVSLLFLLSGLQIVPLNLLKKNLLFKKIGLIEAIATVSSSLFMVALAFWGAGVWTLIGGHVFRALMALSLMFYMSRWIPKLHFDFKEVSHYLRFGLTVSFSRSIFYLNEKSDQFFAARSWTPSMLGLYIFALQLAKIPMDKLISLVYQVSFPVFARLQKKDQDMKKAYLNILRFVSTIVFPVYISGFLLGEDLIKAMLNEKWYSIIFVFKCLCLAQIITALVAINNRVHTATGRPQWNLFYNTILTVSMASSFWMIVDYGLNLIVIPWLTTYLACSLVWIGISVRKLEIKFCQYVASLSSSCISCGVMVGSILLVKLFFLSKMNAFGTPLVKVAIYIVVGYSTYVVTYYLLDRQMIKELWKSFNFTHKEA